MKRAILISLFTLATVAIQGSVLAQHAGHGEHQGDGDGGASQPSETVSGNRAGEIRGRLVAMDEHAVTLRADRDTESTITYQIDSRTRFGRDLRPGAAVTLRYVETDGIGTATSIESEARNHHRRGGCR